MFNRLQHGVGKYYLRLMALFAVLSIIITSTLSFVMNNVYSTTTLRDITDVSEEMLTRSSHYSDLVVQLATSFITEVYYSNDTVVYLNMQELDIPTVHKAYTELNKRKSSYPFIHSIYLYNSTIDNILGTLSSSKKSSECEDQELVERIKGEFKANFILFPRKLKLSNSDASENVITMVFIESKDLNSPIHSAQNAVAINIYESYFREQVKTAYSLKDTNMFIMDQTGRVLSHSNSGEFMMNYSSFSYVSRIIDSPSDKGSFIDTINNRRQLVTYVTNSNLHWTIVNLIPYESLMESPRKVQKQTLLLCSLILMIGLILSGLFSKSLYKPIRSLLNLINKDSVWNLSSKKMNELDYISQIYMEIQKKARALYSQNQTNLVFLREEFLKNLLIHDMPGDEIIKQFKQYEVPLEPANLQVVVFEIDYYTMVKGDYKTIFSVGMADIIGTRLSAYTNNICLPLWEGEIAVIMNAPGNSYAYPATLEQILKDIQTQIRDTYGYTLSIGLGPAVEHVESLRSSYLDAQEALKYRFIYGSESILSRSGAEERILSDFHYPEEVEKALLKAIKLNNPEEYEAVLDSLLFLCRCFRWQHSYGVITQMALNCIHHMDKICQGSKIQFYSDYNQAFQFFQAFNNLDEIKTWFCDLFAQHRSALAMLDQAKTNKTGEMIQQLMDYIGRDYANPNISLEFLADMANLSPNYLSKIFKDIAGINVSDYIAQVRFEKAKALLRDTDTSVTDIAVQCGFVNINYFYYAFKRNVGLTPSSYRGASRNSNDT
mgnify:CR=1 FL=1